jgi:Spy/CpxP family protein refolding chaperone
MKRIRLLAIASTLVVAFTTLAQQPSGSAGPTVQAHLKMLAEKLGLTDTQQVKAKPILEQMNDAMQKIMQDGTLSLKEQSDKIRPIREKADKKLRKILNEDQKAKLDQLEHQPHPKLHGELNGAAQN